MRQCDAQTLSSTYSDAHRCLKKTGIKKVGKRALCMHHRSMRNRKTSPKSGG
jgi:hypothetical protein